MARQQSLMLSVHAKDYDAVNHEESVIYDSEEEERKREKEVKRLRK